MINDLPLNLTFELTEAQQGAMECKSNIKHFEDRIQNTWFDIEDQDELALKLLEHRASLIEKMVADFGPLTERQKGHLATLLEYVEMSFSGGIELDRWSPSLITGEWQ